MQKLQYTEFITNIYSFCKIENLLAETDGWLSLLQKNKKKTTAKVWTLKIY